MTQESYEEGYFLPILLPSCFGTKGRFVLLLNWYPYSDFLDQSYAPVYGRLSGIHTSNDNSGRYHHDAVNAVDAEPSNKRTASKPAR